MNIRARSLFVAIGLLVMAVPATAQVSALYLTDGTATVGTTHVYQGGGQVQVYTWAAAGEMPIAVGNFGSGLRIRQAVGQPNSGSGEPGDEYLPSGAPT